MQHPYCVWHCGTNYEFIAKVILADTAHPSLQQWIYNKK